ncbi:response regulator [Ramlibacter sp.]|uniref:response regulator n=1 Tax=Ramlibacter sp. TaxID=1917967 RepID=UPI003D1145DC
MQSHAVKVYLADDSAAIRVRVRSLLEGGAEVIGEGATPAECVEGILRTRPDVVVLDVQLEGGPGLQVLKAVRHAAPDVGFVVFTNNSGPAYRKRYLAEGAYRFLDKSGDTAALPVAVHETAARVPA